MKTITELINQFGLAEREPPVKLEAWALLNMIRNEGGVIILKLDGQRERDNCTVVVSGGGLGEEFFRKDGADLDGLIAQAIDFYDRHVWAKATPEAPPP